MRSGNGDRILRAAKAPVRGTLVSPRRHAERLVAARAPVALFLDIDGTLLNVASTPSSVHVPPELPEVLAKISRHFSGALAIVTGRAIVDADRLLKPLTFIAAGVHGAELRTSPKGQIVRLGPSLASDLTHEVKRFAKSMPGVIIEDKGRGIALHYRLAPELRDIILGALKNLLSTYPDQFTICEGRKVVEILPPGFSKGRALRKLAFLPEFAGRLPIMLGDDFADIDAFEAAENMGGYGLKVAGENFSDIDASFNGPDEVRAWLERLANLSR